MGYVSMFDIKKAFYQLPIRAEDGHKTTFSTPHGGSKRLTRSLMGHLNSPSHCQRILDRLLSEFRWKFVIVYIDDIIVFSPSFEDHCQHIRWVLSQIHRAGLTLDKTKAYVGFESIRMLGHVVSNLGLATQEDKVAAMLDLPRPKTYHDLQQCLGFFDYYREFVESYAMIAKRLQDLLVDPAPVPGESNTAKQRRLSKVQLLWAGEHDEGFSKLKEALANATYLSHAVDGQVTSRLYVDACRIGFGAALHVVPEGAKERPVTFISRSLKPAERRYWPTELEMGALVWALQSLEPLQ